MSDTARSSDPRGRLTRQTGRQAGPGPRNGPARRDRLGRLRAVAPVALVLLAVVAVMPSAHVAEASEVRLFTLPIHRDRIDDVRWSDTWGAARSGGRSHIGVDMLGEKMVPLVAVRSGTISWGRFNNDRGSILRLRDDDGWEYQYIHFNNDSPGTDNASAVCTEVFSARICSTVESDGDLARGTRVVEGEVIGYMGDGGNAENTAPHLHFEVYQPNGNGGVNAINPTPSVDSALARLLQSPTSAGSSPPYAAPGDSGFADYLWFQIHGRYPQSHERTAFQSEMTASGVWQAIAGQADDRSTAATIDRLYLAFFLRYPDADGIRYWVAIRGGGESAEDIAEWFAESDEFRIRYAGTDFSQFLDQLYQDVLNRPPDPAGKAYWLDLLERGVVTRGTIVVYFTEGEELRVITGVRNEIVALSLLRDGDVPTPAEVTAWTQLRATLSAKDALAAWYPS